MSRCFPYLAADSGGASAVALDESLIESIKLQKEKERQKEKEERKKEKKRERKEKKARSREENGSLELSEPSRKKRKHNEGQLFIQKKGHQKGREDAAEHLEGSSVTEESGPPASLQNLYDSDRSQNSNQNENPGPVVNVGPNYKGLVVRFKLPLVKHKDQGPQNLKDVEPPSCSEDPCFSGRTITVCQQEASETVKHAISSKKASTESGNALVHCKREVARTVEKPLSFNDRCIQAVSTGTTDRQEAVGTAGKTPTSNQKFIPIPRAETVCKQAAAAPETAVKPSSSGQRGILLSRLEPPQKREANGAAQKPSATNNRHISTATVELPHKQEAAEAALKSSSDHQRQIPRASAETPCEQHGAENTEKPSNSIRSCLPACKIKPPCKQEAIQTADKPSSTQQGLISRSTAEAAQTDDRPSSTDVTHTPPGKVELPSKQEAALVTTSDKSSGSHCRRRHSERKDQQFKDLVMNWNPLPLHWECSDNNCEQSWLFETWEQQGDVAVTGANTCKSGLLEELLSHGNVDGSYQVHACYASEVDMFVMPYAIPY